MSSMCLYGRFMLFVQ